MATYTAEPADFIRAFPGRIAAPPKLLLDFADWIRGKPWGTIGCFELTAGWSDDVMFGGERFFPDFALFMKLPEGSRIGYWLTDGASPETAPIVLLGSEGQYETLAVNLPNFLMRIGAAGYLDTAASDLTPDFEAAGAEGQQIRDAFVDWVSQQMGLRDMGGFFKSQLKGWVSEKLRKTPGDAFARWAETQGRAPEIEQETDPALAALTAALEPYRPAAGEWEWARTMISVGWAGEHVEIVDASHGHVALPEKDEIRPLLAGLRDGAAARTPGLGLWNQAWIDIGHAGPATLKTDYLFEPKFFLGRPDPGAFRADEARTPRTQRRVPDWLEPMLAG